MNFKTNSIKNKPLFEYGNWKVRQILTFVDKKNAKKHIRFVDLAQRINQANRKLESCVCCFTNDYLVRILWLIKQQGFIFNYYKVPATYFLPFLKFGFKANFHGQLVIVYLKQPSVKALREVCLISKPARYIYIGYKRLRKLIKNKQNTNCYFINTTRGLITHKDALQGKIGGQLLCILT